MTTRLSSSGLPATCGDASNAHAHGTDVDDHIEFDATAALNNAHAHGLAAPLGVHAGVVASPYALAPAATLTAYTVMGASPDALLVPATIGMPLPVKRAVPSSTAPAHASPATLARASQAALARASPATPAYVMFLSSGMTISSSCANNRDEDEPS